MSMESESGPVDFAARPQDYCRSEFTRRVTSRNGRLPARLNETCVLEPCATPGCGHIAAANNPPPGKPLFCDECWEESDALRALPPRPLWSWSRVCWRATFAVVAVVAVCVVLCLVYGVVK